MTYRIIPFSFDPRNIPTSPIMIATTPPTSIHIALSVGEPVKNREMSELNDFDAATPKIVRRIPPARIASETALFIEKSSFDFHTRPHERVIEVLARE
jgi:hypothetical protein